LFNSVQCAHNAVFEKILNRSKNTKALDRKLTKIHVVKATRRFCKVKCLSVSTVCKQCRMYIVHVSTKGVWADVFDLKHISENILLVSLGETRMHKVKPNKLSTAPHFFMRVVRDFHKFIFFTAKRKLTFCPFVLRQKMYSLW
jgi:hypothetical protein